MTAPTEKTQAECFIKSGIAAVLCAALLVSAAGVSVFAEETQTGSGAGHSLLDNYPLYQNSDYVENDSVYYVDYLQQGRAEGKQDATASPVKIDLAAGTDQNGKALPTDAAGLSWDTPDLSSVTFAFAVPQDGYYNFEAVYTAIDGGTDSPRRSMEVDGKQLFQEMINVEFSRIWKDDGEPWVNSLGDEVRPKQVEVFDQQTIRLHDSLGRDAEPMRFYLTTGTHTVTFHYILESFLLSSLTVCAPEKILTYQEVASSYQAAGYQNASGSDLYIRAERPAAKSDCSLRLGTDSDPKTEPAITQNTVLNVIGGSYWNEGGQSLTWNLDIEQAGLYQLNLRAYQKYNDGLSSYRTILVDGKVPFEEFLCYEFPYQGWQTVTPSDANGNPYLLYFAAGRHTLTLSVVTMPYARILSSLQSTLSVLSDIIQSVIMITGIDPDVNFDYELDKKIPGLMDQLQTVSDGLGEQVNILSGLSEKASSSINSLKEIQDRIDKMIAKPFDVAKNLNTMIDDQTTLSNWINGFNNLPLMLDYITVTDPSQKAANPQSNFFQRFWFSLRDFMLSFVRDYDSIVGTTTDENGNVTQQATVLDVWVSRGKEWAEILKQITDEEFTQQTGIYINYNMLPSGQLGATGIMMLAKASGTEPDIVLGTDTSTPTEYGMRGVSADLSQFSDYPEVASRFCTGSTTPYEFKGAVYALPETIDFSIMYYRADILSSLNIPVPNTWQELYSLVLPELKRNGMDFWYEGGLNLLLFQQGGDLYSEDGLTSGLGTRQAYEAFKQFCDLYNVYEVPKAANFYNRFRSGQMPIGISSFNTYLLLTSAAPELEGKWSATVIPATERTDEKGNTVYDRSNVIAGTSSMIFESTEHLNECWQFLKWYTSTETQTRYATDIVSYIGPEAKWFSANTQSFDGLSWDNSLKTAVQAQRVWCKGVRNVIGGYITARHETNAYTRSVVGTTNYRESIEKAADDINRELQLKNEEFELRAQKEAAKQKGSE